MKNSLFFLFLFFINIPSFSQTDVNVRDSTELELYIDDITVTTKVHKKMITGLLSGKVELQASALEKLPKFLGSADPLRTMQLFSGVQTSGDGNAGLYIRGGDPGHNLIMLNDAPVYNAMHMLGIFSVFNSDHLDKFTLMKAHTGPEYGGRNGGVLAVQTKSEIVDTFSAAGNVGLISSQATLAIPLNSKSSLYASARKTYVEWIIKLIEQNSDNFDMGYGFQDYNLTYVYQPNKKNKVILNGYYGGDKFSLGEGLYQADAKIKWDNVVASANWDYRIDYEKSLKQTLFYSYYKNKIGLEQNQISAFFPSDIMDMGYKGKYSFRKFNMNWSTGADYVFHHTNTQYPQVNELFGTASTEAPLAYHTHETGVFVNMQADLTSHLVLSAGLRYSSLFQTGPYSEKYYDELGYIVESNYYDKGKLVKYYGGLEPRILLDYMLDTNKKINLSYDLSRQYMTQVAVSNISFPTDFWIPASFRVPPQVGHTLSAGYFQSLSNDAYEFSVEGYYKRLTQQAEFDGELFDMINQAYHTEEKIVFGKGWNYGVEAMVKKNHGRLTGWLSYTYGWAWRKFDEINDGKAFHAKHDRRHDFSVVGNYAINEKWDCSAIFVYATGNTFTMPVAIYIIGESAVSEYGPHNGARMPAYQRLDLSVNYWFTKSNKRESGLNFSLFNAYFRKNPLYLNVKVRTIEDSDKIKISTKGNYLYSLLPSISYMFKF